MPSSAMSSHSSWAFRVVRSEMEPRPVAREMRVFIGPKQIRFTTRTSARAMAMPDWVRMTSFFSLGSFTQAVMAMIPATITTASAAK